MGENIIRGEDFKKKIDVPGLGYLYYHCLKKHANQNKLAQILSSTDERDTYKSLLERSIRTALYLQKIGIKKDDIVCLYGRNHLNSCIPYISSHFIGAIPVCLSNPDLEDNKKTLLELLEPKVIFTTPEYVVFLKEQYNNSRVIVFGEYEGETNFSDIIKTQPNENSFKPIEIENIKDTAIIFFTSGTTGAPKAVCINHFSMLAYMFLENSYDNADLDLVQYISSKTANIVTLDYLTFYSISTGISFFKSIYNGYTRVIWELFNPSQFWILVDKYKINYAYIGPMNAYKLYKTTVPNNIDTSSLAWLHIAGAHVSTECILALRKILHPLSTVVQTYGQTEMSGYTTLYNILDKTHRKYFTKRPDAVGLPGEGISYKVVHLETNEILGPNQKGEVLVKGPMVMNGYYKMDSKECFDPDGYYKTGDIGYYDPEKLLYIVDRIKGVFKVGWYRIHANEIEDVALKHPAVIQVAVFGYKNSYGIVYPSALIVKMENSEVTVEEIRDFVNSQVEDYKKIIGPIKFVQAIPVTSTGKVKCGDLRSLLEKV
ncbi:unnamed protein product [Brassicogethes aeneus]|uniref:Uncharacterized protein n=1 Tax=Brassicogethes aeneus TaxID=1431903 RepID=A0A9P0FLU6_BRAAE|nr:unnamed protein product [Brassicogethes aeneus]